MRDAMTAKPLLSRPEQVLYGRLVRAFPGHIVLARVALLGAPKHAIADFVVLNADFVALAAVELDDPRSASAAQRERDRRMDAMLRTAGIKVLRLPVDDIPGEPALKALVTGLPVNSSATPMMRCAS
jgi:hypothetical protein